MEDETQADDSVTAADDTGKTVDAPSQDPVKVELDKETTRSTRTEAEKAAFSLRKNAERAKELGIDPAEILGLKQDTYPEDEDAPVTVGMLRKMETEKAHTTAIQMADDIQDENERKLVKQLLETRIKPSGDAEADLRLALGYVNSVRNGQMADMVLRRTDPKRTAAGGSASVKVEEQFTPTADEARMMQPPYNLSKEKIQEARKKAEENRK